MKNLEINLAERNLNGEGCFRLVGAMIHQCFIELTETDNRNRNQINQTKKDRIEFAKQSKLISHFADLSNLDEKRIRSRIIEFNQ